MVAPATIARVSSVKDQDASDEAQAESRLRAAGRPAAVSETLQLFSHDIRSAMSDVVGGLRLIEGDRLDPETRMQMERVKAAGDMLAGLVDAALMAAAGETLIRHDDAGIEMGRWLDAQRQRWSGRATERGRSFEIVTTGDLPARLLVQQIPLDRIVGNLIGNALSHAATGPVRMALRAGAGGLTVEILDDGPGYPAEVLARHAEGVPPLARNRGEGAGLGLRIVEELSHQIGGALSLSNRDGGQGGHACLTLPPARLDWSGEGRAPCIPPDLSGLRILVAEDNLTNQAILRQLLDRMQADAVFVGDGVAALDALEAEPFDIALIDIEMPRLSGLQVMQAIRARGDAVAEMPVVALTAYVLRDNREAIYAAGADGIIGKPIASGAEFGRAILRLAGRPAGLPEPEDVLAAGRGSEAFGVQMDEGRLDALLDAAGPDGAEELLERLDEDLRSVRDLLADGVEARSVPVVRAQTHILIALSGAVGADRLWHLAEVLNIAAKRRRLDELAGLHAPFAADLDDLIALIGDRRARLGAT